MIEDMQIEFGKQVREARLDAGVTQETVAEILNTCCASIRKIEQGKGNSNLRLCVMLSLLFSINTDSLRKKYIVPYLRERVEATNIDVFLA